LLHYAAEQSTYTLDHLPLLGRAGCPLGVGGQRLERQAPVAGGGQFKPLEGLAQAPGLIVHG